MKSLTLKSGSLWEFFPTKWKEEKKKGKTRESCSLHCNFLETQMNKQASATTMGLILPTHYKTMFYT